MTRVAINGLGRIGRATLKIVLETPELELAAVNDLIAPDNVAYLLKHDSVYGRYERDVRAEAQALVVDGRRCPLFSEKEPSALPWRDLGIQIVLECTGAFRRAPQLVQHLQAGARRVILSAPEQTGEIPTIVPGVNEAPADAAMISCASCTTNCIAPVAEIVDRYFGIDKGVMTTVHAYTASQNLVDGPKSAWRRGRAAAVNLVPTGTGAAEAATRVLEQLSGHFEGSAVRGPVAVGSLADMVFSTQEFATVEEINDIFRREAESARYRGILGVSEEPLVSSDIKKDPRASVVDLGMTRVVDGDMVKIMSWYDNEWGYSSQLVREAVRVGSLLR